MRLDDIHPAVWFCLFIIVFLGAIFYAGNLLGAASCRERWERSGLRHDHSFLGGCMVQRKDGTWVPSSTIRELTP